MTLHELQRAVGALRSALGWGAVAWFGLMVASFAVYHGVLRWQPKFVLWVWGTNIQNLTYRAIDHLFQMRLVLLVLVVGWFIAWLWEKRI